MINSKEYIICRQIADFLRYQYPRVIWRFDMAGLNLSKAQAGMNKAIQCLRGYPDLFIAEPRKGYHGLFIEIKADGVRLNKRNGDYTTMHIDEQALNLDILNVKGYMASFAVGFDESVKVIRSYLD